MSIKKQLQEFYAQQGLEGKHLRKAIQWDMKAVSANRKAENLPARGSILVAFTWSKTPQGVHYWSARSNVNWD